MKLGKKTYRKMIFRAVLFTGACLCIIIQPDLLSKILTKKIVFGIKIYHLFWLYLLFEMLPVLFSGFQQESYCGKHFNKHYQPTERYNKERLHEYWKKSNRGALRAFAFWIGLNSAIFIGMLTFHIDPKFAYLLFLFYYLSDMICVNIWCPFHSIILKNKCCNECRIYNWGHWMYFTPFVLVPNFWTMSLLLFSLIIFAQWEYHNYKHPERFSPLSNQSLQCHICEHTCRYNPLKRKRNQIKNVYRIFRKKKGTLKK